MEYKIAILYSNNINNKATESHSLANSLSCAYSGVSMISLNKLLVSLKDEDEIKNIFSGIDYIIIDKNDVKQVDDADKLIQILESFVTILYIDTNDLKKNIIQKIKLQLEFYNRKEKENNLIYIYNLILLETDIDFIEEEIKVLDINNIEDYEKYYYLLNRDEALSYNYSLWAQLAGVLYAESKEELKEKHREYLERKLERLYSENKNIINTINSLKDKHLRYNEQINEIRERLS